MIFKNSQGKIIGDLTDNVFSKTVEGSKHLMKIFDAYGVDRDVLNKLPKDCKIQITDKETGILYEADRETFRLKGIKKDFGHSIQYFLPRKHFTSPNQAAIEWFDNL